MFYNYENQLLLCIHIVNYINEIKNMFINVMRKTVNNVISWITIKKFKNIKLLLLCKKVVYNMMVITYIVIPVNLNMFFY